MSFKDHFSTQAATYAASRPRYPQALYDWLAAQCAGHRLAWDAGAGNGQCALGLAPHFERVIATEPSAAQLANAPADPRVEYRLEPAESPSLDPASADLVTVAQALHWFDLARFWPAVERVLAPAGVVAVWTYERSTVNPAVDAVFMRLYEDVLGPFWPAERAHVVDGYARLSFPFQPIVPPAFDMRCEWTLPQYLAYLSSWSASARYQQAHGSDPVALVADAMAAAWGDPLVPRTVRWPLLVRAGRRRTAPG